MTSSAIVHVPTLDEAIELYEMRIALDPIAVRKAVDRTTDKELDEAEAIHQVMLGATPTAPRS